ncbi:MAG: PAS domain-containing protein [Cloacibacillus evryensis]
MIGRIFLSNNISDRDVSDKLLSSAWRDFLANTQDFMFVKNTDLAYINCSAAFAGLVGLSSPDGVTGLTDLDIFKDRALAERYRATTENFESGEPLLNFIEPLPPKEDGTPRYSSTSKYAFRDESGAVAGIYAVGRDVTIEYEARMSYEREFGYIAELHEGAYASTILDVTEWRLEETHIMPRRAARKAFASIDEFKDCRKIGRGGRNGRDFFRTMTKECFAPFTTAAGGSWR